MFSITSHLIGIIVGLGILVSLITEPQDMLEEEVGI